MVFFRLLISAQTIWLVIRLLVSSDTLKSRGGIVAACFCVLLVLPLGAGASRLVIIPRRIFRCPWGVFGINRRRDRHRAVSSFRSAHHNHSFRKLRAIDINSPIFLLSARYGLRKRPLQIVQGRPSRLLLRIPTGVCVYSYAGPSPTAICRI
jgi:hypothetical protein